MKERELIRVAMQIAIAAHRDQKDLDGNEAIYHPLEVGLAGNDTLEMIVGFLHDVVEDSDKFTFEYLEEQGIPKEAVEALKLLTHAKGEPYADYVRRIAESGNELAIAVKLHDLNHNLERGKRGGHWKQVKKHTLGKEIIETLINKP